MGTDDKETKTDRQQTGAKAIKGPSRDGTLDESRGADANAPEQDEAIRDGIIEETRNGDDH